MPQLTIGLAVYNEARHLRQTLASILAQTFTDWELLVLDDGSTDGSVAIVRSFADARVRLLADGRNLGPAARFNQIARDTRGPFVARMDADDLMHPRRLEKQVAFLQAHPEVDAVGCALLILDERGQPAGVRVLPSAHADLTGNLLHGVSLASGTVLARAAWLRRFPFNETNRHAEDWELWFTSASQGRFANLPEPLYLYREYEAYSLAKYVRAKREMMRLQWRARQRFGSGAVAAEMVSQLLRIGVNLALAPLGGRHYLVRRRSRPLRSADRVFWQETQSAVTEVLERLFPASAGPRG